MRKTLLDLTQDILSDMSSDEVNSISDTVESMQVATIIKNKFFDIVARAGLTENKQLVQLTDSTLAGNPTVMYVPDEVCNIEWIKYLQNLSSDGSYGYLYVTILPFAQFNDYIGNFNSEESNVFAYNIPGHSDLIFFGKNDAQPKYCTVLNNSIVIFDSYLSTESTTLVASHTMCYAQVEPAFTMVDTFIPNLNDDQFPLLLNEARAMAFYQLKQTPHTKAEQEIKRQWNTLQRNKSVQKNSSFAALPDFGRTTHMKSGTRWTR